MDPHTYMVTFELVLEVDADTEESAVEQAEGVVNAFTTSRTDVMILRADMQDVAEDQ